MEDSDSDSGTSGDIDELFKYSLTEELTTRNLQDLISIAVAASGLYLLPVFTQILQNLNEVPKISFDSQKYVGTRERVRLSTQECQAILLSIRIAVKLLMTGFIAEISELHPSFYAQDSFRVFIERMRAIDKKYQLGVIGSG